MNMKLSNILTAYNLLSQVPFKNNEEYLNKDVKRKVVSSKIEYNKFKKEFEEKVQEFIKAYDIDQDKLQKDQEYANQVNEEVIKYQNELLDKEHEVKELTLTDEEYNHIVDIAVEDVKLNGMTIPVQNYLEIIYETFCK